jgi:IS605 OrfB family transposase
MLHRTAYRFRAYPAPEQASLFRRTAGCCRLVYNLCLEQRRLESHRSAPRRLTAIAQINELKDLKAAAPFLKEVPHHPLQQAIRDLDRAFTNFFERRAAYPKPRTKFRHTSFRYPDPLQIKLDRDGQRIFLPKAGWVPVRIHREIIGDVKNVTVSEAGGWWFVSIAVEQEIEEPTLRTGSTVGIDLGVVNAIATSEGEVFALPRISAQEQQHLAAVQKTIARRKKGSRNHLKAILRLRRIQARHARRRADAKHKATSRLVRDHAVIVMEDLKVRNMTASARGTVEAPGSMVAQKAGLNRSLLDMAPGETRRQLEYKMERAGGQLIVVPPKYTSQQCSCCGWTTQENRSSRDRFACVSCGFAACADVNAARNILAKGLTTLGRTGGHPGMACGSIPVAGRKQELRPVRVGNLPLQGQV